MTIGDTAATETVFLPRKENINAQEQQARDSARARQQALAHSNERIETLEQQARDLARFVETTREQTLLQSDKKIEAMEQKARDLADFVETLRNETRLQSETEIEALGQKARELALFVETVRKDTRQQSETEIAALGQKARDLADSVETERKLTLQQSAAEIAALGQQARELAVSVETERSETLLQSDKEIKTLTMEAHRTDIALSESERRFKQLADCMPAIVWSARPDGYVDYYNKRWSDFTGIPESCGGDASWTRVLHPDDVKHFHESWYASVKSGQPYEQEIRFKEYKTGEYRWQLSRALPIRDKEGNIIRWYGTCTDISEHKRLEDQLRQSQKMDAIGRLAGGVAHDFNNLLTVILGRAELTELRSDLHESVRNNINLIYKTASRAATLTRQLLQFSRQQVLQPQVLDLNTIVPDMQEMLRRLVSEDIELLLRLNSNAGRIKADAGQMQQVVMNLVVNARDAMPNGGKLTIETSNVDLDENYCKRHEDARPGPHVMLAVGDTGCGMSENVRTHIFEPFFTTKELGKGTGLGLSTVYGIVKQAGGNIFVYSEVNHGTVFKVYFPAVKEEAQAAKTSSSLLTVIGGGETILLVEDEEGIRELLVEILAGKGYSVLVANDGKHGIQCGENHKGKIHLLLTDVVMPKMNGKEVAIELLQTRGDMKVLFMSGYTSEAIVNRGVLDEGIEFLEKPFTPQSVARRVREVLDSSQRSIPNRQ